MEEKAIDFAKIEKRWQDRWEKKKIFQVKKNKNQKIYVLEMFPYPSGDGLHMGHALNYVIGDIYARFKIMNGFNVLHPMGYDALGLPAENAAIRAGKHPADYTKNSIKNFTRQFKSLGLSYDWSRAVNTAEPGYYKWDQWIFLKMFEKGLAYQKEAAVNYCPSCATVLANEQAQTGKCERCDTPVEIKHLKQWFFKITDYADELYENIDKLDGWPERTKAMQKNWIGKSHGTEIDFEIADEKISNVVIVHGANDSRGEAFKGKRENQRHWFPWLGKELSKRNVNFSNELYPKDWNPEYSKWKKTFEENKIDESTILVGHSLGCGFISRWLSESKKKVKKIILVAPYILDSPGLPWLKEMVNFSLINMSDYCDDLVVFYSDNDYPDILESVSYLKEKTNGRFVEFRKAGHFCESNGFEKFPKLLDEINNEKWSVFTTRPDTLFGVTFMVVSAQHPQLKELVTKKQGKEVEKFLKKITTVSQKTMKDVDELNKEGVFTGSYAINPVNNEKIPVYAGNFVVADYGSGMVMAVPAHDQRDFEFAKKYKISTRQVIGGKITDTRAYTSEGKLINSGKFDGIENQEAKEKITLYLKKQGKARKVVNFKLRDWLISRQRYWGTPIPIIHCKKCGAVPVKEKNLPIVLPKEVKFGKGNPLETNEKWIKTKCPKCGGEGSRETDTMDTFVNSSWYFLRYCDPKNNSKIFDKEKANYWCPVDQYIGGAEHACMHLIYSRFYTKFLADLKLINFREPAKRLFHQGMLAGEGGMKMSKSKGNVITPDEVSDKYGMDTARFFLLSLASPDKPRDWDEAGIQGSLRFIKKIFRIFEKAKTGKDNSEISDLLNKTISEVTKDYENFVYRDVTIKLKKLFDLISEQKEVSKKTLETSLKLINPLCPHITEELWEKLGHKDFISTSKWPEYDEKKIKTESKEKTESKIESYVSEIVKKIEEKQKVGKVYVYVMPFEIKNTDEQKLSKKLGKKVKVFAVNDSKKYDPENRAKKSLPGMPGIFIE